MKKTHLLLLILTAVLALSSAYSLAAINQVYNIDFEWYSQLNNRYESAKRDVSDDKCAKQLSQLDINLLIIDGNLSLEKLRRDFSTGLQQITYRALNDNIYIFCSLGKVNSPEYRIRVVDIAQRGSDMEVMVSINTPDNTEKVTEQNSDVYKPTDIIKIKKTAFPTKGRIFTVFKNQDGKQLEKLYCEVK